MTTQTLKKIQKLEQEVAVLKSFMLGLVPLDKEGEYKTAFLESLKKTAEDKAAGKYEGKGSLLKLLK